MVVCVNPQWFRPTDVDNLWGDPTKGEDRAGLESAEDVLCAELVEIMAKHDWELAKRERAVKDAADR